MLENLGWLQPVLIAALVVFLLDLVGNMLSFSNRFVNAATTALVFATLFATLIHLGLVKMDVRTEMAPAPAATAPATPAPATP
jgi:hypothetical protein